MKPIPNVKFVLRIMASLYAVVRGTFYNVNNVLSNDHRQFDSKYNNFSYNVADNSFGVSEQFSIIKN